MPFDYISDLNISYWRPVGLITLKEIIDDLSNFVNLEKKITAFDRFSDISECDFSNIKFDDVRHIYLLRTQEYHGPPVKNAFYIKTDLQFGIARIYQTLMTETPIKVEIFKTPVECANYLNIPVERLFPKNN